MQISFDPLQQQEAAAVRAMLDALRAQQVGHNPTIPERIVQLHEQIAAHRHEDVREIARLNDLGMALNDPLSAPAPSATPLDPAPSTAAADLFSTAPVAPPATSATIVPAPPVPSAPIPPAPPAPAASASPAGVDSTGLPWDERIHSGTKAVNADGTWRARRGLNNPALVKEVEAELRQLAGIPVSAGPLAPAPSAAAPGTSQQPVEPTSAAPNATAPAVSIPNPPATTAMVAAGSIPIPNSGHAVVPPVLPVNTDAPQSGAVPSDIPLPPATTTSAPPTAPIPSPLAPDAAPQAPSAPVTFGALMTYLSTQVTDKKMTTDQVEAITIRHGIPKGSMGKLTGMPEVIQLIAAEVGLLKSV